MRCNSFGRSAVFAALGGILLVPWLVIASPLLGMRWGLAVYLVALTATALAALAPSLRRGLGSAAAAVGLGTCLVVATRTLPELVLGLAVLFATARGAFLYRLRPARAAIVELVLVGGGLLFARFLVGPSLMSIGLAVWGFLLVQSFFFLVGGVRSREPTRQKDPFDVANERARALLDGLPI